MQRVAGISTSVSWAIRDELEEIARQNNCSLAAIARRALLEFLERQKSNQEEVKDEEDG